MTLIAAEIASLFTADISQFEQAAAKVTTKQREIDGKTSKVKVDADTKGAVDDINKVVDASKKVVDKKYVAKLDTDIERAEFRLRNFKSQLEYLDRQEATPEVQADTVKAKRRIEEIEKELEKLRYSRNAVMIEADTSPAEEAIDQFQYATRRAGGEGGRAFLGGFTGALLYQPIAGAVVGLAQGVADGFNDAVDAALAVEKRSDVLMARTGLDPITVGRIATAAGEAYANNWGESIEANMDTARRALQAGLLDPDGTKRATQSIIESLAGVADILEQDVSRVARSATQLIKNGLADSADEAFDILVKGQQAGLDVSEDWLDTLDEYSTKFRDLGLTAPQALGLMRQATAAGARDTDKAADALKEFAIRAIDGSKLTAEGYKGLGLNASKMQDQVAKGGKAAAEGLGVVLDKLREIEDPAKRDAIAVALFGTQAEDLGDALYAMDLGTAVKELGEVEGAARTALDALGDNAAADLETARRNIELAADGIAGALAQAFGPEIEGLSDWVTSHRAEILRFLAEFVNGAIQIGRALVEASAAGIEGFGTMIDTVGPPILGFIEDVITGYAAVATAADPTGVLGIRDGAREALENFREFKSDTEDTFTSIRENTSNTAEWMRTNLIENTLDPLQDKFNEVAGAAFDQAKVHDSAVKVANEIDKIGVAADGSVQGIDAVNGKLDLTSRVGQEAQARIRAIVDGMREQAVAGVNAGEGADALREALDLSRDALVDQLVEMGLSKQEAKDLADAYGAIPEDITTTAIFDDMAARAKINAFKALLTDAQWDAYSQARTANTGVVGNHGTKTPVPGGMKFMAAGGLLAPLATMVPPGTFRVVGDRMDVPEAYIPMDGSARSIALLMEAARRMPGFKGFASGGIADPVVVKVPVTQRNSANYHFHISRFDGSLDQLEREAKTRALEGQ